MSIPRLVQHRPEREEKQKNKALSEAKRENHQLRKKLAREVKKNQQLESILDSLGVPHTITDDKIDTAVEEVETLADAEPEPKKAEPEKVANECPKCKEPEVRVVNLAGRYYAVCEMCLWRNPMPVESAL